MAINNNGSNRNICLYCAAVTGIKDNYKSFSFSPITGTVVLAAGAMFCSDTLTIAFKRKFRAVKLACLIERR